MKIAIFSDTHGRVEDMLSVIEQLKPNHIIHLGDYVKDAYEISYAFPDIPLSFVAGNNDYFSGEPFEKVEFIGGISFFLVHGHQYNPSMRPQQIALDAKQNRYSKIALFGHTHEPFCNTEHGVLVLNPGSISSPRRSHKSYGIIEICGDIIRPEICLL